jgi:hypothetical protein
MLNACVAISQRFDEWSVNGSSPTLDQSRQHTWYTFAGALRDVQHSMLMNLTVARDADFSLLSECGLLSPSRRVHGSTPSRYGKKRAPHRLSTQYLNPRINSLTQHRIVVLLTTHLPRLIIHSTYHALHFYHLCSVLWDRCSRLRHSGIVQLQPSRLSIQYRRLHYWLLPPAPC